MAHYLNNIDENSQSIAKDTEKIAETLNNIEYNTKVIAKIKASNNHKLVS